MSSGKGVASGGRVIHQDYIARVRYSNALPPPSMPPKLLDIPNTGLASGQYTAPGFASRLAREQPLNIEADAELGMPLDLVGMPNIFEGDESSIQAPSLPPPIHPNDKTLLRPLGSLSRSSKDATPVSFLRRTEYISSTIRRLGNTPSKPLAGPQLKRPALREPEDSPAAIRRKIEHSFETAEKNLNDLSRVKHPQKKHLKCVDAFPILPDLDAFPDSGTYVTIKFLNNPVPVGSKTYDTRLLSGLFKPIDKTPAEEAAYQAMVEAYERDPQNNAKPGPNTNYDFFLTKTPSDAQRFRAKFDVDNPENNMDDLYTAQGDSGPCFAFQRVRSYETTKETELDHKTKYDHEVLLAYSDGDLEGQKALWYYPVMQRSTIRPQRQKRIDMRHGYGNEDEVPNLDQLDVTVDDPTDELREHMLRYKEYPLGWDEEGEDGNGDDATADADGAGASPSDQERDQDADADGDGDVDVDVDDA